MLGECQIEATHDRKEDRCFYEDLILFFSFTGKAKLATEIQNKISRCRSANNKHAVEDNLQSEMRLRDVIAGTK